MKYRLLFALFSVLLLLPITFAQNELSGIESILAAWEGVIFILIFIFILLAVAGVFKAPKSFGNKNILIIILMLVIILAAFIIPAFVPYPTYWNVPDSFKYVPLPHGAVVFIQALGLPAEWGYVPAIIYLFILPFAGIYTITWAFLETIIIFKNKNVNRLLAFIITLMTIPVGIFVKMVWILFSFMGAWSIAIFTATFVVGIFFRGLGLINKEYGTYKAMSGTVVSQAKNFEKYANDKISKVAQDSMKTPLRQIKQDLIDKIYRGETNEKNAKKIFDEQYKKIVSG